MHYDGGYVPDGNHETKYGRDSEETLDCQTSSRSKRDRYRQGRNTRRLRYLNSVYAIQDSGRDQECNGYDELYCGCEIFKARNPYFISLYIYPLEDHPNPGRCLDIASVRP